MREIVSIHLGQAGVQMGTSIWELFGHEHNISPEGEVMVSRNEHLNRVSSREQMETQSFYKQMGSSNYFAPRAILVDSEPTVIGQPLHFCNRQKSTCSGQPLGEKHKAFQLHKQHNSVAPLDLYGDLSYTLTESISATKYCKLFQRDFILKGTEDAANNFARGYHTTSKQIMARLSELVRQQVETSDRFQGFMMFHSMGGGTGSGLSSRLTEFLSEEFPKQPSVEVGVFPSPKVSTAVVEPYNTILATHATLDLSKCVIFTDNEAIHNICNTMHSIEGPTNRNLNNVLSQAVSAMTTGLRFDCQLMIDFSDFQTNLIPYPRLHFPVVSMSPVVGCQFKGYETVNEMTSRAFETSCCLAHYSGHQGTHMACCLLYRGEVTPKDVSESVINIRRNGLELASWTPTGFKVGIGSKPPTAVVNHECVTALRSVCLMSNNTGLRQSWKELVRKYRLMLAKGAFLHWYVGEGLEQNDFVEALEDMRVLLHDYLTMNE